MSEENVAAVLRGVKAVNRGDPDAFVATVHPDVVWESAGIRFRGFEPSTADRRRYESGSRQRSWSSGRASISR
jgi:hypothetical protein